MCNITKKEIIKISDYTGLTISEVFSGVHQTKNRCDAPIFHFKFDVEESPDVSRAQMYNTLLEVFTYDQDFRLLPSAFFSSEGSLKGDGQHACLTKLVDPDKMHFNTLFEDIAQGIEELAAAYKQTFGGYVVFKIVRPPVKMERILLDKLAMTQKNPKGLDCNNTRLFNFVSKNFTFREELLKRGGYAEGGHSFKVIETPQTAEE